MKHISPRFVLGLAVISLVGMGVTDAVRAASSNEGTLICRVTQSGEAANAKMIGAPTTLVCKPLDPGVTLKTIGTVKSRSVREMGPDLTGALTPAQVDAAWKKHVEAMIQIDRTP